MREALAILLSWIFASIIGFFTLSADGLDLKLLGFKGVLVLFSITGMYCLIYMILFGTPVFYFLFRRQYISRSCFILAGLVVSLPMVVLGVMSLELEWLIRPMLAGIIGGTVFAVLLPTKKQT